MFVRFFYINIGMHFEKKKKKKQQELIYVSNMEKTFCLKYLKF